MQLDNMATENNTRTDHSDGRKRASKIPVRRTKNHNESAVDSESGDGGDDETGIRPESSGDRLIAPEDILQEVEDEQSSEELSPRDLEVPIIEAPEEFRGRSEPPQPAETRPPADNGPETGDTIRRAREKSPVDAASGRASIEAGVARASGCSRDPGAAKISRPLGRRLLDANRNEIAGDAGMGIDGPKHNPDRDNLKSLLKRPGRARDKRHRVVFNENRNEFFDADYIILIREECDYDDEDDDGVCTCNQHEMVRLACCEPNCNCYDGLEQTPQSPKFAPPLEFVDAVTLSPPEGYKDMELEEQQLLALQQIARRGQRTAVCRECSASHDDEDDGEASQSDNEVCGETNSDHEEQEEKEKTDQSQQTTPTTPPNDSDSPNSQRYILETITMTTVTEQRILKEVEEERKASNAPPSGSPINGILKGGKLWKQQSVEANAVKPPESQQQPVESSAASDEESGGRRSVRFIESEEPRDVCDGEETAKPESKSENASPESTEMMLTFKLGNHVLISNNSLKPNSAVRQLFPCTKQLNGGKPEDDSIHQYLVTAESLRAFEEAKRSKLPQIIQSGETDESIKRAIERNTLRRSLIRYEPRSKKNAQKADNSLVERIKQLTCDVDDQLEEQIPARTSPPGEEAPAPKNIDKSFSPSSSSTASSNSSSVSSTYKKITDLFGKRDREAEPKPLPDLGNGGSHLQEVADHCAVAKVNSSDARKQFLAPLTACVSGLTNNDEYYYQMSNHVGDRASVASSVGTEYSLEDIDEGLKTAEEESKKIAPDVLAGTPSASESGDELAMFVQQDASRIERIKKKYQPEQAAKDEEDDEHDDYGFNRRPSVRGIKPRFGSTTEILQQIQSQLQPPPAARWPYYSESGLTDNSKARNMNPYQYPVPEEVKTRQYRPTSLPADADNIYQNCANQRCPVFRANGNQTYAGGCPDYYQSFPRARNGRPLSPPPLELSKTYHQTMVYIPYNHIEPPYYQSNDYRQNQINKRYVEPIYQPRIHPDYAKAPIRVPLMRSESPVQYARSTQTAYYRYRPAWPGEYRHSFPAGAPRFPDGEFPKDESPTKPRFMERGAPEGAAAGVAAQDASPTSPQNPPPHKPLFYAMNV